ncbi:MAG TPA: hypothetical protein VN327_03295 [Pseudonocardiaceae bacterium]|nr:hypothetical protein [Pseudonocardiaceae bacterium]
MRTQDLDQRLRNTHGVHNGLQNAELPRWLDGPLWYPDGGAHSRDGRSDRERHTERTAGPTIGLCGPGTRIAGTRVAEDLDQAGARLPQVLIREADSRSQQPPRNDQAAEHDNPRQCAHHPAGRAPRATCVGDGGHRFPLNLCAQSGLARTVVTSHYTL